MRVKFYPKNYFTLSVCSHKHNADFTFTECTDAARVSSSNIVEMYGFRNNLKLSMYVAQQFGDDNDAITGRENTGLIKHNIYFVNDYWENPNTQDIEKISDYDVTVWTQKGVDSFGVLLGTSKAAKYPNHGQEMYDLTGGSLGYNYTGSVSGASNQSELIGIIESQNNWLKSKVNKDTSSISYRNGRENSATSLIPYFLGGRNSEVLSQDINDPSNTFYGLGLGFNQYGDSETLRSRYINYIGSFRYWDKYKSLGLIAVNDKINTEIPATISNNGWFRNFNHWHDAEIDGTLPVLDDYLALVRSNVGGNKVYSASSGDAIEYMFLREIAKRVSAQEKDGKLYIITDVVDSFKTQITSGIDGDVNLPTINQSLSVKIDITGSSLVGKNIVANFGKLINLGGNEFIVEIPFNKKELFQGVVLSEGEDGYYDTARPTATPTVNVLDLDVAADMKVKAVLFEVVSGGDEIEYRVAVRSNTFSVNHSFTIETGKDYKIGVISEFGESNLVDV